MKRFLRPATILVISLLLVLFSITFSQSISAQSVKFNGNTSAGLFFQTDATPQPQVDRSEIGSTDGITVMSFVIVVIILVPMFIQRKYWSQT